MLYSSPLPLQILDAQEYENIKNAAELIVADLVAPKVMRNSKGNYLKFFRRKRLLSSALFLPYAVRFVRNALHLKRLGIPTITPMQLWYCPEKSMHIVEYQPLPGELLRAQLQNNNSDLIQKTAGFIARLHHAGVYFRSLHFENIIINSGVFGLIDIADMKIYKKPLGQKLRLRNFQHFLRYPQDRSLLEQYGLEKFKVLYEAELSKLGG